jgi:hypothetical protein
MCRDEFRNYATVEVLITGDILAYCHRTITSAFDARVDMWIEAGRP